MGQMTVTNLISTALEEAGNTGLSTIALTWMSPIMQRLWAAHDWPFLRREYGPLTMASGVTYFDLGDSGANPILSSNITEPVIRVRKISIADSANNGYKGFLWLDESADVDPTDRQAWADTLSRGTPFAAELISSAGQSGYTGVYRWRVRFAVPTDRAYRLLVDACVIPQTVFSGGIVPMYPNDDTLIQAIIVRTYRHMNDEREPTAMSVLMNMIREDKRNIKSGAPRILRLSKRYYPRG